ncbi:hypothetical protein BMS3Abin05_02342 [bacterium BMS3Abin05]|nr:hypothetical protein BMS3Abin05_02342 [bacterium BMS3Abin05]GBE26383.1 hypothetical protein BMS3Bbin03_00296 [bacterium BMS3Bbin03]HDK36191.1 hypothetical protein [Bacteroidota bacterium]HDL78355.1 hypothetical protein [Bacteroidota bacterium]HDZ11140.1 hypothetical protein [Bacteroidota bacterium]
MKRAAKLLILGFLFGILFMSCSRKKDLEKKRIQPADTSAASSTKQNTVPQKPKGYKSIHQLELEQHEKGAGKPGP